MKKKLIPLLEGPNDSVLAFEIKKDKIILHGCKIIDRKTGKVKSLHSFEIEVSNEQEDSV